MGTKNNPGQFDCYANAGPDEPMFILLGRDPMAPSLVRMWAQAREADGELPDKVEEAQVCAEAMRAFSGRLGKAEKNVKLEVRRRALIDAAREICLKCAGASVDSVEQTPRWSRGFGFHHRGKNGRGASSCEARAIWRLIDDCQSNIGAEAEGTPAVPQEPAP